jgi:hypothetical protein
MKTMIASQKWEGHPATEDELKQMMGIPGRYWPDAGVPVAVVQGVKVWVKPIYRTPGKKSSKHRAMCECPKCHKVLSAGRLHQHVCGAK